MIQAGVKHFRCWNAHCQHKWSAKSADVYKVEGVDCPACKDAVVYAHSHTTEYPQTESDTDPPRS